METQGRRSCFEKLAIYAAEDRRPDLSVHTQAIQIAIDTESACQGSTGNLPDYCQPDASTLCLAWDSSAIVAADCNTNAPTFTSSRDAVTGLDARQWWIRDGNKLKHVKTGRCLDLSTATPTLSDCSNTGLDVSLSDRRIAAAGAGGRVLSVRYTGSSADISSPESSAAQGTVLAARALDLYSARVPSFLLRRQDDAPLHLEIFDRVNEVDSRMRSATAQFLGASANGDYSVVLQGADLTYSLSVSGLSCTGPMSYADTTFYASMFGQLDCGDGRQHQVWQMFSLAAPTTGCEVTDTSCSYLVFKKSETDPTVAEVRGLLEESSPRLLMDFLVANPEVQTLNLIELAGSESDQGPRRTGYLIRAAGLNTHIPADSFANSGAADLFLSGVERTIELNPMNSGSGLGVHSWGSGFVGSAILLAENHPEHLPYVQYAGYMLNTESNPEDNGANFYYWTVCASGDDIYFSSPAELARYNILTSPLTTTSNAASWTGNRAWGIAPFLDKEREGGFTLPAYCSAYRPPSSSP